MIYACSPFTPRLALRTPASMLDCEHCIWVEKTSLLARILPYNREENNLVRDILEVQLAMGWPGLISEVKGICKKVGF